MVSFTIQFACSIVKVRILIRSGAARNLTIMRNFFIAITFFVLFYVKLLFAHSMLYFVFLLHLRNVCFIFLQMISFQEALILLPQKAHALETLTSKGTISFRRISVCTLYAWLHNSSVVIKADNSTVNLSFFFHVRFQGKKYTSLSLQP